MSAQPLDYSVPPLSPPPLVCASPVASPAREASADSAHSPTSLDELLSSTSTAEVSNLIEAELFSKAAQKVTGNINDLLSEADVQQLFDSQVETALTQNLPAAAKIRMEQIEQEIRYCEQAEKSGVKVRSS